MISKIWWINFSLSAAVVVVNIMTIGVLLQNPSIPQAGKGAASNWPGVISSFSPKVMDEKSFSAITEKNPFSADRKFKEAAEEVVEEVKEEVVIDDEPKELEEDVLALYATVSGDSLKYAIISNPGIPDDDRPQIRVKQGDKAGDFSIVKIEPKKILVSRNDEIFEVNLKKSESIEGKPESKTKKEGKDKKKSSSPEKTRVIKTLNKSESVSKTDSVKSVAPADNAKQPQTEPAKPNPDNAAKNIVTEGGVSYEIMKTPFGTVKRRIQ